MLPRWQHRGAARLARHPGRLALAVFGAVGVGLLVAGCSGAQASAGHEVADRSKASSRYGSLPGFLPRQSLEPDGILQGTRTRPALTTEGDSVRIGSGANAAVMTVTGPEVPGEGLPYQASATTCTWEVTVSTGDAPFPIDTRDFNAIDHLGVVYRLALVPGQPTPPASLAPHSRISFELRAVMTVGEGLIRWSPDAQHVVASWDFEIEND